MLGIKHAVDLLQEAYVDFGFNYVSYNRQQTAATAAKATANVASIVADKKGFLCATHRMPSLSKRGSRLHKSPSTTLRRQLTILQEHGVMTKTSI
jgi:hypothetical protein